MITQKPIQMTDSIITVTGKILYSDKKRRIHIKKPIRDLFAKHQTVNYIMELCLNEKTLIERMTELSKNNVIPIMLYFTKEEEILNEQTIELS